MNTEDYEVVDAEFFPDEPINIYDPLYKSVTITPSKTYVEYNHVEGFDYAPEEMQEILHKALMDTRANPSDENKIRSFDIFFGMILGYWAEKEARVRKIREEAQAA